MDVEIVGALGLLLIAGCLLWAVVQDRGDRRMSRLGRPSPVTAHIGPAPLASAPEAVPPVIFDQPDAFENDRTTFFDGSSQYIQLDDETLEQLSIKQDEGIAGPAEGTVRVQLVELDLLARLPPLRAPQLACVRSPSVSPSEPSADRASRARGGVGPTPLLFGRRRSNEPAVSPRARK